MACHITSNSNFDKGGCVIQIEWTKALCNIYQPMLQIIVYKSDEVYQISMKQTLVLRT